MTNKQWSTITKNNNNAKYIFYSFISFFICSIYQYEHKAGGRRAKVVIDPTIDIDNPNAVYFAMYV